MVSNENSEWYDIIPWVFVLVDEAPDSSGVMRLAAKTKRKTEIKIKNLFNFCNLFEIHNNYKITIETIDQ